MRFLPSDVRGGRDGKGDGEELVAKATGHVAPNEVSACHRASHQTVSRHAHVLNSTPCKRKAERAERQSPICLKPVSAAEEDGNQVCKHQGISFGWQT